MLKETDCFCYLVIPWLVFVKDHGSSKTSSWVDSGAGDRNGGQMNHKHREPNWEWSQNLQFRNKI